MHPKQPLKHSHLLRNGEVDDLDMRGSGLGIGKSKYLGDLDIAGACRLGLTPCMSEKFSLNLHAYTHIVFWF